MRNRLLFWLPVFLLVHASFIPHKTAKKINSGFSSSFDPADWIIDETTALRMEDFYKNCRGGQCRQFKKQTFNSEIEEYLKQTYTIVKKEQRMGRYSDADLDRYRRARKIPAGDPRGNVSGFSTVIIKYTLMDKSGSFFLPLRSAYVDNSTICPPPDTPPCN